MNQQLNSVTTNTVYVDYLGSVQDVLDGRDPENYNTEKINSVNFKKNLWGAKMQDNKMQDVKRTRWVGLSFSWSFPAHVA